MLDPDTKEGLTALLETANEAGPDWKEDILGFVEEDLYASADGDLIKAGVDDSDERDAVKAVVAVKALWLAYIESLDNIEDLEARQFIRDAVEGKVVLASVAPLPRIEPAPVPRPSPPLHGGFKAPVLK